tara:strand:+ start:3194 stop:3940 length:747 start_codon:yes stop_codon:yes gene_type:complete
MLIPLFDYNRHRIIMESYFRFSGKDYLYFPKGVRYYTLYRTTRKINSFNELKYIAEKFVHLNPFFNLDIMIMLFLHISDRSNGHIIRTYGQKRVEDMVCEVYDEKKLPYCARLRKIIFNPSKRFDRKTKMKIVGELIGTKKRPPKEHIASIIKEMFNDNQKITISKVAEQSNTTRYMIRWYFTEKVNQEINLLNDITKEKNLISRAIEAIDLLTEGGNKVKMRELKKITSIRNYQILKRALEKYQSFI